MWVIDTSAWTEWLAATPAGEILAQRFPDPKQWIVPSLVQLELTKWITRELGEAKAKDVLAFTTECRVVDLDTPTAVLAAELCVQHRLATADAVIYATAKRFGVELVTCDAHFRNLPGVIFLAKPLTNALQDGD